MAVTTDYLVLLPDDESRWADATEAVREETRSRHRRFQELLRERGHRLVAANELTASREAKVIRGPAGSVTVTEGPYAEAVEQLSGFYLVSTADVDDLIDLCGWLTGPGAVELRACEAGSSTEGVRT